MTKEELENYEPKGELTGFPKEIIARMLECQEEQGNEKDVTVLEKHNAYSLGAGGFDWDKTKEEDDFWYKVILKKDFDLFFKKYPKKDNQDNSQEFNLENYEPKGELEGFPKEIIARMLDCQEEQGNKRDISVFEGSRASYFKGFKWYQTEEGYDFWDEVILKKNFDLFFEKYPKQDNSQEFRVGDKVYDIIYGEIGVIKRINLDDTYSIHVSFNDNTYDEYLINGVCRQNHKIPQLLHYRDDYDYSVIDFNNLPKRQEHKRWRAEERGIYYFIKRDDYDNRLDRVCETKDYYGYISNDQYKIGNYFQTKEQAQEVADKLKEYFKQLINK